MGSYFGHDEMCACWLLRRSLRSTSIANGFGCQTVTLGTDPAFSIYLSQGEGSLTGYYLVQLDARVQIRIAKSDVFQNQRFLSMVMSQDEAR